MANDYKLSATFIIIWESYQAIIPKSISDDVESELNKIYVLKAVKTQNPYLDLIEDKVW